ncbi:HK97 family phage prohead protease [Pontibacter mucosus]|uniref:HK97 family phage prohead protease n=1 Tax=Pontibacter mucosus TaxID=1649266 RepID=A0A2T5YD58_9BACT|nr:HK97 family phage prohead protease [Pontibacter mucosus]PTX14451.1 HK97 family phage prohead protease [Pontibacter mucosus]
MKGRLQTKDFVGSVKDVDMQKNIVTGYLSVFGNVDHDNDITEKGAFAKSIRERGPEGKNNIVFMNYHKWDEIHAKFQVLREDNEGLYFETKLNPEISYSRNTLHLYNDGVLDQHSYGWITVRDEVKNGVRHLQECYLMEGSNVYFGANEQTRFTGFKSLTPLQVQSKIERMQNVLRNGNLTDEGFIGLEIGLKQLEAYILDMQTAPINELPPNSTALVNAPQDSKDDEATLNLLKNFSILN